MIASVPVVGSMRSLKGSGAGVLERPTIDPPQFGAFPLIEEGTEPFLFFFHMSFLCSFVVSIYVWVGS